MSITVSGETAKNLKEKGRKKSCEFVIDNEGDDFFKSSYDFSERPGAKYPIYEIPSAQEILDELPHDIKQTYFIYINTAYEGEYNVKYKNPRTDESIEGLGTEEKRFFENENLAEALAELWIWCVDNGYIQL